LVKVLPAKGQFSREILMKRCHQCGGKFGLVRHHHLRHPFCSLRCLERFRRPAAEEVFRQKATPVERSADIEQTLGASGLMSELDQPEKRR
jgi:hypothetical protein